MKKILIILLLLAAPAYGAKVRGTSEALYPPGTQLLQIFDNASTVGQTGEEINIAFLPDQGSWELVINGSPTTFEVAIEGSIRGVAGSWHKVSALIDTDTVLLRHIYGKPVNWVRPKIVSKTGSGSFDAYIIVRGN